MSVIYHPFGNPIEGRRLDAGELLHRTDYYASTSGRWELCPCPGVLVPEGSEVVWVRPGKDEVNTEITEIPQWEDITHRRQTVGTLTYCAPKEKEVKPRVIANGGTPTDVEG